MKDYEATPDTCRSPYGVELDIAVLESRFLDIQNEEED